MSWLPFVKNLPPDAEGLLLLGAYILQEVVNDNGIQIGTVQHVLITQTDVFVVHLFRLLHGSNKEQITCGAHTDVLMDVSN